MTKIGEKLPAVFLAVAMAVTFVPVLGTQTAYAEGHLQGEGQSPGVRKQQL